MIDFAARSAATGGVGFVDVNDTTKNRARINSFMASIAIERATGIETIPHLTPRDMSVTGIESLLLGAHAEGIRNVLAITGDPPTTAGYASNAGVYEVEVRRNDGSTVGIHLDSRFQQVGSAADDDSGHGSDDDSGDGAEADD